MTSDGGGGGPVGGSGEEAVVVPLGLDLGLYRGDDGAIDVPRVRRRRTTVELDRAAYRLWQAAHAITGDGRLLTVAQLAKVAEVDPSAAERIVAETPELMVVPAGQDDVLLVWTITNLRMLMVNVGPPAEDGSLQLGLVDERFDLIAPPVFDVLARCARTETAAQAFVEQANRNAADGAGEQAWSDPMGLMWAMWAELPYLLAHGVAWLDPSDRPYRPGGAR